MYWSSGNVEPHLISAAGAACRVCRRHLRLGVIRVAEYRLLAGAPSKVQKTNIAGSTKLVAPNSLDTFCRWVTAWARRRPCCFAAGQRKSWGNSSGCFCSLGPVSHVSGCRGGRRRLRRWWIGFRCRPRGKVVSHVESEQPDQRQDNQGDDYDAIVHGGCPCFALTSGRFCDRLNGNTGSGNFN